MKKCIVSLMMIIFCLSTFGFDIPKQPNPPRLVNDYIGLLTSDQVQILEKKLVDFDNKTSIQITIVVLDDLDGDEASDVATEIGHTWGVGQKQMDNGIVFLIVKYNQNALEKFTTSKHGDYFIATGYGLESYMTDSDAKDIGESHFIPYAKEDEYYEGITESIDAMIEHLGEIGWQQRKEMEAQRAAEHAEAMRKLWNGVLIFIICATILGLCIFLFVRARRAYLKAEEISKQRKLFKEKFVVEAERFKNLFAKVALLDSSSYPEWAMTYHKKIMKEIKGEIVPASDKERETFLAVFGNDLNLMQKSLQRYEELTSELSDLVDELEKIPTSVQKYRDEAPGKLTSAKDVWENFRVSIQVLKDKGFKLSTYEIQLGQFKTSLSLIETKSSVATESKDVYDSSIQLHEEISLAKQQMDEYVLNKETTTKALTTLSIKIDDVADKKSAAQTVLEKLKTAYPKQNWEDLVANFIQTSVLFDECVKLKKQAEEKNNMTIQDFENAKNLSAAAHTKMQTIFTYFQDIHDRKAEILAAKDKFTSLQKTAESKIADAKKKVSDSDVESGAKRKLAEAEDTLKEAISKSSGHVIDWLVVIALLISVNSLASESSSMANDDIETAQRKRKRKKEEEESHNSYYSSSHSSYSSSSGGGFGGFGGGGFGGGGAGGSW